MGEQARRFMRWPSGTGSWPPSHQGWQRARRAQREVAAGRRAVRFERLERIGGTGGREAAGSSPARGSAAGDSPSPGRSAGADHARGPAHARTTAAVRRARRALSASDVALTNCLRSKPARSRTTWAAAAARASNGCAHVVDLALDGIAGDGAFGPALGNQGADPRLVPHSKQGLRSFGPRPWFGGRRVRASSPCDATRSARSGTTVRACHHGLELRPGLEPLHVGQRAGCGVRTARLDGQALAALGAACVDDGAAAAGLHADQEAVGACAAHFGGLVGAFHDVVLRETHALSWKFANPAART